MKFYLGTHHPHWLGRVEFPLCVSHRRLCKRKSPLEARCPWVLDSGGFTELQLYGKWTVTPREYANAVTYYRQFGKLQWAAPQDWMCEPAVISGGTWNGRHFAGTRLTVAEHQELTVRNYLTLCEIAPDLPFIPVLQGFTRDEYLRCADMYDKAGVDLEKQETVGIGSVCRRQGTKDAHDIITSLAPLRLHGFGVKITGLELYGHQLASSDSLAWSFSARRQPPLPGCTHKNCANCLVYAGRWRHRLLGNLQPTLFDGDELCPGRRSGKRYSPGMRAGAADASGKPRRSTTGD
jgi:hypothetical protein